EYPVSWESFSTGVLENDAPAGSSYYNGLLVQVQKRLSNGLSIISNYAYSRAMEEDLYLNPTDTSPEKMVSPFDITNHFVLGATYQLPFGTGDRVNFHSRWANGLLGGWTVNGIYMYQTGLPVVWDNSDYLYVGGPWDWNPTQTGEEYVKGKLQALPSFNTAVFNTTSADQPEYSIRTFPEAFSYLRYDSTNDLDCSLLKDFNFSESKFLELRFEAFNALNRPQFGGTSDSLNVTPTNSSFGVITKQSNISRAIQLGARFVW
ncbi:MAG: TonB-dependent receptor, partial [Terriglobia bacterium]